MNLNNNTRCRAKNPATCWRHGTGLGFDANRAIKEVLRDESYKTAPQIVHKELKLYDSEGLAVVIMNIANNLPNVSAMKVRKAILLASDLHKTDTRANRELHERTPYIEHPLRNTLRIIRYGCDKENVLIGSILHDTVEDHPFEIAREYAKIEPRDEHHAREISYEYIRAQFGSATEKTVRGMSNPIIEDKYMPAAQRNIIYRDHVREAIQDPDVCITKLSDFTDNALSLHHTERTMTSVSLRKKSAKYLLAIDAIEHRLKEGYVKGDLPVPQETVEELIHTVTRGRKRLQEIYERHS